MRLELYGGLTNTIDRFFWIAGVVLACGSAAAQETPAAGGGANEVQEVVVTATKREQSLQETSSAVTALGTDRLATAQVNSIQDMQTIVPSVNFGSDFNQAKIFIRGVGANTSTTGNSTAVALHVDGAVVARAEAQLTSLFDLQRVEVLRGPQGTLYGRNATGGSINLITAKPTRELSGYARATYGNYDATTLEGAISGPITDKLLVRVAAKDENRGGFGVNPVSGQDVDDLNRSMARAHLEYDFTDDTSLLLTGEYFRQNDSSGAVHYLRDSFPGVPRLAALGAGGYANDGRDLATEGQPGTDTTSHSVTATFRMGVTDALAFTNIANYRSFKTSLFQDLDLSAVLDSLQTNGQSTTFQERRIDSEQYSDELQLNWKATYVDLVAGLFYFHERQRPIDNVGLSRRNGMASNIPLLLAAGVDLNTAYELCGYGPGSVGGGTTIIAPKRVCTKSDLGTEAYAGFGQANVNLGMLGDRWAPFTLKLGGRYSHEEVESANPSIVIAGGGRGPVLQFTTAQTYRKRDFSDFTPELGIQWQATNRILAYYTYAEGFKAGSGENASGSTTIVDPEKLKSHEIGIKSELFERRLQANLAVYTYKLEGAQLNKTLAGGPTGFQTIFQNAARTSADGAELELAGVVGNGFSWSGGVSWTDAKFDDYSTLDPLDPTNVQTPGGPQFWDGQTRINGVPANRCGPIPASTPVANDTTAFCGPSGGNKQLAGNRVRNTPEWAWNLHGEYILPFNAFNGGRLTVASDVSHKDRVFFSEYERDIESAAPYTLVDAWLQYASPDSRLHVQLWGKNLFDHDVRSSTFALATGRLIGVTWLPPRTYGLTVGYSF
jgi:iron complex outermembrane recepter protein